MRRSTRLLLLLVLFGLLAPAHAGQRLALVIGNGGYHQFPRLPHPGNDATDMARELQSLGFSLVGGAAQLDVNRQQMSALVREFGATLNPGDLAVFYYAGHGTAVGGDNFLIPVDDSAIQYREDVPDLAYSAANVLKSMEARQEGVNIIILDACRDNPLPSRRPDRGIGQDRGLLRMSGGRGTAFLYAASVGEKANDGNGRNGVFTGALLAALQTPGLELSEMFRAVVGNVEDLTGNAQTPWQEGTWRGEIVLHPGARPGEGPAAQTAEQSAFAAAQAANTVQGWRIFKQHFPGSQYGATADIQIALLSPAVPQVLPAVVPAPPRPASGSFRDCPDCPEMVHIAAGSFLMGSPTSEAERAAVEGPQHSVRVPAFSIGKYAVTFDEWDACMSAGACTTKPGDEGMGRGRRPVINVSWNDAQQYARWLSGKTGHSYRLPSEAEWEYVARAGTTTPYYWGNDVGQGHASCDGCGSQWDNKQTAPVGSFPANPWGLFDMQGNVFQWTQDCYHDGYAGAPTDGSAWTSGDCSWRIDRGGSWFNPPRFLRAALRVRYVTSDAGDGLGFRLARTD